MGISYIEQRLQKLKDERDELKPYYEFWLHSKRYLSEVLNTISHVFPHYTLHDASHSHMILDNVVSFLGKKVVDEWSAGDSWLMLMASYCHDCGMFVSADAKEKLFHMEYGEPFRKFIEACQEDENCSMHKVAIFFKIKGNSIYFDSDKQLTAESYEYLKILIAEYIRRTHADRVEDFLDKAEKDLGYYQIPKRLLCVVKKICQCHTKSQDEVLKIPFAEKFIDSVCHPRYVTALLRLGDVLDIDSTRIPKTVLDTLSYIPKDSRWHLSMNMSLTHLRIDEKIVEITAETKDRKTAELATGWFGMIESEIQFQLNQRYNIMPKQYGYTLPQVGTMNVQLMGFDDLDGKKYPKFEVDTDRAMHLLEGSDLYNHPAQCMREVFQNAVDATYLRIYCEHFRGKNITNNSFSEFCSFCANSEYKILVEVTYEEERLKFKISDNGIGMDKEDFQFIAKVGSSSKNTYKEEIIQQMPDWMRPSGTFGIGFQSLFLMTDEIKLTTHKWNTDITYEVNLYKPESKSEYRGNILIQTKKELRVCGTTIEFDIPKKRWFGDGQYNLYGYSIEDALKFEIKDRLESYMQATWLNVDYKFTTSSLQQNGLFKKQKLGKLYEVQIEQEKKEAHLEQEKYYIQVAFNEITKRPLEIFYRNQRIEDTKIYLERCTAIPLVVNILSKQANDILGMSRNVIKEKVMATLKYVISEAILLFLQEEQGNQKLSDLQRNLISMMLKWNKKEIAKFEGEEPWKLLEIRYQYQDGDKAGKRKTATLKELMSNVKRIKLEKLPFYPQDRITIVPNTKKSRKNGKTKKKKNKEKRIVIIGLNGLPKYKNIHKFIEYVVSNECCHKIILQGNKWYLYNVASKKHSIIVLAKDSKKKVDETKEQYLTFYVNHMKHYSMKRNGYLPCPKEYLQLEVNQQEIVKFVSEDKWFPYTEINYPMMLSPFVLEENEDKLEIKSALSDEFYERVLKELKSSLNVDEVKQLYKDFIDEWNEAVEHVQDRLYDDNLAEYL